MFFSRDEPRFVHASGPYRYVRHPFYASYLLAYGATALLLPGLTTLGLLGAMTVYYAWAAAREERKFAASGVAAEYQDYRRRTGRFVPRRRAAQQAPVTGAKARPRACS
jgi:protein-S-isoprenylcysteine O-methyltransferase Ste14